MEELSLARKPSSRPRLATDSPSPDARTALSPKSPASFRLQAFRFDPPDKKGVPEFYTQRISASGFPVVASTNVNPYALKEAAYLVDLMLAKRPDVRMAMIRSGARLCVLAHNEFTTDQPEFARLQDHPMNQFHGISSRDYWDARAVGWEAASGIRSALVRKRTCSAIPGIRMQPSAFSSMNLPTTSIYVA